MKTSRCSLGAAPELAPSSPHEEPGYLLPASQVDFFCWAPPVWVHAIECQLHLRGVRVRAWDSDRGNICWVWTKHITCAHSAHPYNDLQQSALVSSFMASEKEAENGNLSKIFEVESGEAGMQTQTHFRSLPNRSKIQLLWLKFCWTLLDNPLMPAVIETSLIQPGGVCKSQ